MANHFLNWARVLAEEYGGQITATADTIRLNPGSDRWEKGLGSKGPVVLSVNPNDPESWRVRLQCVEKRIAQAVISAPVAFSCSVDESVKRRGDRTGVVDVVRFAFGLSLSLGPWCARRYTAYYVGKTQRVLYIAGQDRLFESCDNLGPANLGDKQVINSLRQILDFIPQVKREYEDSETIQKQVGLLKKAVSSELRDLDRLYVASHGQYAQLLGRSPESVKGDDAIELEYFNRLEDIVGKYRISVRFAPLSLGLVRCNVQVKKRKTIEEVTIPFVDDPLLVAV